VTIKVEINLNENASLFPWLVPVRRDWLDDDGEITLQRAVVSDQRNLARTPALMQRTQDENLFDLYHAAISVEASLTVCRQPSQALERSTGHWLLANEGTEWTPRE